MLPRLILLSRVLHLTHPVLLSLGWCHMVVSNLLWLCRINHKNRNHYHLDLAARRFSVALPALSPPKYHSRRFSA